MEFMGQKWQSLPFPKAAETLRIHLNAEREACVEWLRERDQEGYLAGAVSFWSSTLGAADPPSAADWNLAATTLDLAWKAYRANDTYLVIHHFCRAVAAFNVAHKKYLDYHESIQTGAARAVTAMNVTIAILSAATAGQASGIVVKAGASAALKVYSTGAEEIGKYTQGVDTQIDVLRIMVDGGKALAVSLISGGLSKLYMKHVTAGLIRLPAGMRYVGTGDSMERTVKLFETAVKSFFNTGNTILIEAIMSAAREARERGGLDSESFVKLIAEKTTPTLVASTAWKKCLETVAKEYSGAIVR